MSDAKSLMSNKVITVEDVSPIVTASDLMKKHHVRHLPVMNQEGRLVGMICDRDIERAEKIKFDKNISDNLTSNSAPRVESFMSWPIKIIDENTPIADIAKLMIDEKISALVVNSSTKNLKGIITTEDMLEYLVKILDSSNLNFYIPQGDNFLNLKPENQIQNN